MTCSPKNVLITTEQGDRVITWVSLDFVGLKAEKLMSVQGLSRDERSTRQTWHSLNFSGLKTDPHGG